METRGLWQVEGLMDKQPAVVGADPRVQGAPPAANRASRDASRDEASTAQRSEEGLAPALADVPSASSFLLAETDRCRWTDSPPAPEGPDGWANTARGLH